MTTPVPPDQPGQSPFQVPPDYQPPPPPRSGMPTWLWVVIIGGGASVLLCVIVAVVGIGILTMLGSQVSEVFSEINSGLVAGPVSVPTSITINPASANALGDTAALADLNVTLDNAYSVTTVEGLMDPLTDYKYWIVEVSFENTSASRTTWIGPFDTSVQDDAENTYDYYWEAVDNEEFLGTGGSLDPGESLSGKLIYEVPEDTSALYWIYRDPLSGELAVFEIQ